MFFYHSLLHNRQFRYLGAFYTHSLIRLFAVAIFQIFNGIYIYQTLLGFGIDFQKSIATTALNFALIFLIQALAIAPALWLIDRKGLKFAVFWGNGAQILVYVFLALAKFDPILFLISAIFDGIQLALYWTAAIAPALWLIDRKGLKFAVFGETEPKFWYMSFGFGQI